MAPQVRAAVDQRRLAGKKAISERPCGAENRSRVGHLEGDTVLGTTKHRLLTLVDRKTGFTLIDKLKARTVAETNRAAIELIRATPRRIRSVTVDNGTEFHGYKVIEDATGADIFFATPHHSWERGTNENTNGLIRQYAPKRTNLEHLTQADCDRIAHKLNHRPRRRLGFRTPAECYLRKSHSSLLLHFKLDVTKLPPLVILRYNHV